MVITALGAVEACRAPTQVTIDLSTSSKVTCGALSGIQLSVAANPGDAEQRAGGEFVTATATCAEANSHEIGTLVLTPGKAGTAAVVVVAGIRLDARTCKQSNGYKGCVVARRSLSFRDHVTSTVPVVIDPDCIDVPCDEMTTCNKGSCISSKLDCSDDGSCPSEDPRGSDDAGGSGDSGGADGAMDASMDGPPGNTDAMTDATADGAMGGECPAKCLNATCPSGQACCYASTGMGMIYNCETLDFCERGGGSQMANGVYECCRYTADCGGLSCCLSSDYFQTSCKTSCGVGEQKLCQTPAECGGQRCMMAMAPIYATLLSCQP
jgi:hypothetical protein